MTLIFLALKGPGTKQRQNDGVVISPPPHALKAGFDVPPGHFDRDSSSTLSITLTARSNKDRESPNVATVRVTNDFDDVSMACSLCVSY